MTLTLELTEEEETRLRRQAQERGVDVETLLRSLLSTLPDNPQTPTWGAQVLSQWRAEKVFGPFGDPAKNSSEVAEDLRQSLETSLFSEQRTHP